MKRLLFFTVFVMLLLPITGYAQFNPDNQSEERWLLIEEQMMASLESDHEHSQIQTLRNTILFSMLYRDRLNLHRAVAPIIDIHTNTSSSEVKELALAALQSIGSKEALAYCRDHDPSELASSRQLALNVLEEYMGKRYLVLR